MQRNRSYISPYDLDGPAQNGSSYNTSSQISQNNSKQGNLLVLKILVVVFIALYAGFNAYKQNPEKFTELSQSFLRANQDDLQGDEEIEDEGNIMVLGPPWVYLRDTVNDMPVRDTDITFFWLVRGASGEKIKNMLTDCLDLRLTSYHHGIDTELEFSSLSRINGIASPNVREVSARFTAEYHGRMFAFFRHPYQIFRESMRVAREDLDNPLIRAVIGDNEMKITYKELGIAKKVVREKCVVGLLDEFFEKSVRRIYDYFGWVDKDGMGQTCFERHQDTVPADAYGNTMSDNSAEWMQFMVKNKLDLQMYEFVRSVYRAEEQTIIPRYKQLAALEEDEDEDEDEEEEDEEE